MEVGRGMMYIENIFVLVAAPLAACLLCVRGRPRTVVACLLVGMTACLASAYVSSFIAQMSGLDAVRTAVEIAPSVEEIAKLLPLLFYLAVLDPDMEDIDLAFIMVAVGFATMESAFYLGDAGLSDPVTLLLRGLGTAMMHVACGVVVGFGLTRVESPVAAGRGHVRAVLPGIDLPRYLQPARSGGRRRDRLRRRAAARDARTAARSQAPPRAGRG